MISPVAPPQVAMGAISPGGDFTCHSFEEGSRFTGPVRFLFGDSRFALAPLGRFSVRRTETGEKPTAIWLLAEYVHTSTTRPWYPSEKPKTGCLKQ